MLLSEESDDCRVGQGHRGRAEELSDDDQEQDEKEDFLNGFLLEDFVAEVGRYPSFVEISVVAQGKLDRLRRSSNDVSRCQSVVVGASLKASERIVFKG
jgi:hypothetical protein